MKEQAKPAAAGPGPMLRAAVFLCGLAVMGVEMSASKLLAPYFGTSLFTWTNLIGSIMTALSLGYWVGGRLADRHPRSEVLYKIILGAAALVGAIPYLTQPVMSVSAPALEKGDAGIVIGSLLATIALFSLPIFLLGMVSPYAIRLASEGEETLGRTAGGLYALSTVGSIAGTFLPALVTIPLVGTRKTILGFAAVLAVVGFAGLGGRRPAASAVVPAGLAVLAVTLAPFGPIRGAPAAEHGRVLEECESPYHYIQVVDKNGRRLLVLNEGMAVHSVHESVPKPYSPMVGSVWDSMTALPLLIDRPMGRRLDVLIVGLAAGTVARELSWFYGKVYDLHMDGVELDGKIVEMGRKYFDMNDPRLDVHVTDGRLFISQSRKKWDLIMGDAYRQPYIPFHLATKEYFTLVKEHLKPGGLMSINVGSASLKGPIVERIVATITDVFGSAHVLEVINPPQARFNNYVVIAGRDALDPSLLDTSRPGVARRVLELTGNEYWSELMRRRMDDLHPASVDPWVGELTDDRAPVELLTDWMIFRMAAAGEHAGPRQEP